MDRVALGRMQHPVRGILHGSAALASLGGLIALVARSHGAGRTSAAAIYGLTLIAMYLTSALYHSVPWQDRWKLRLQKLDHTFIYALVAATFTALAVGVGISGLVVGGLIGIWTLAALGLARELLNNQLRRTLLPLQFIAVAGVLPGLWPTLTGMDTAAAVLTLVGGACYIVGAVLFVNDRPRLAPRVFSHHEFFHVVVIIASIFHFVAVWRVVTLA
jgi:hemolysin III